MANKKKQKKEEKEFDLDLAMFELLENVSGFEERALTRIGERIAEIKALSAYDTKALENMRDIGIPKEKIYQDLAETTEKNIADIKTLLEKNMTTEMERTRDIYTTKGEKFVEYKNNEVAQQMVKNWAQETAGAMINLSRTKAIGFTDRTGKFTPIEGAIQSTLDKAVVAVRSGVSDFNSEMKDTIEDLGGYGVVANYGSGVTRSVESAVRANILYGVKQSAQQYRDYVGEKFSADGFEVDYHAHPRPSHEFMGGMMYSYKGDVTIDGVTYKDGAEALERLQDYNCLHYATPVILGVSQPTYDRGWLEEQKKKDKEIIEYTTPAGNTIRGTLYDFTQKQRALEREVRKQRRIQEMAKAANNSELARDAANTITKLRENYDVLCEKTGLQAKLERMA